MSKARFIHANLLPYKHGHPNFLLCLGWPRGGQEVANTEEQRWPSVGHCGKSPPWPPQVLKEIQLNWGGQKVAKGWPLLVGFSSFCNSNVSMGCPRRQARQGFLLFTLLLGTPWTMNDDITQNLNSGEVRHATRQGLRQCVPNNFSESSIFILMFNYTMK